MSSNFETLIKGLVEGLLSKDRLVIFHGPPNTGKSFTARVIAEVFGPFVNLDERQLGKDTLILDDVIKKQARCIWLEEMNFDIDFGPALKRILAGYKQGARMAKGSKCPYDYYRCPLIIITTNRNPKSISWLAEEGIAARTINIYWDQPLQHSNCFNINDFITVGKNLLITFLKQRYDILSNHFINRELYDCYLSYVLNKSHEN